MKRFLVSCFIVLSAVVVKAANENWMTGLPDTVKVCRVSIPGTHDSGTAGVRFPMKHYACTQTMDLSEQWDAGIRFFDLRPKLENGKLEADIPAKDKAFVKRVAPIVAQILDYSREEIGRAH